MISTRATWGLVLATGLLTFAPGPVRSASMAGRPAAQSAQASLRARWEALAAPARGRVGVAAVVLEATPADDVPATLAGDERFPMQSVYKFPIAMAALAEVDAGRLRLDQRLAVTPKDFAGGPLQREHPGGATLPLEALLAAAVSQSDNTASDVVLRALGGPEAATAFLRRLGVDAVSIAASEQAMGAAHDAQYRNWATPSGMLALLRAFHEAKGLTPASRERLRRWMVDTPTGPKRLKGALPAGTEVAHKTGTSGTADGVTAATNDVGIITLPDGRHLAVAAFVADARGDEAAREGVIAGVARAAWDAWATR